MIGAKIYYEAQTGDVILTIPEKHNSDATITSKEQDFAMFGVLQMRDLETVDFIQLSYGQHRSDFEIANSWRVDVNTKQVLFEYPSFNAPLTEQVKRLSEENEQLQAENDSLKVSLADLWEVYLFGGAE